MKEDLLTSVVVPRVHQGYALLNLTVARRLDILGRHFFWELPWYLNVLRDVYTYQGSLLAQDQREKRSVCEWRHFELICRTSVILPRASQKSSSVKGDCKLFLAVPAGRLSGASAVRLPQYLKSDVSTSTARLKSIQVEPRAFGHFFLDRSECIGETT